MPNATLWNFCEISPSLEQEAERYLNFYTLATTVAPSWIEVPGRYRQSAMRALMCSLMSPPGDCGNLHVYRVALFADNGTAY